MFLSHLGYRTRGAWALTSLPRGPEVAAATGTSMHGAAPPPGAERSLPRAYHRALADAPLRPAAVGHLGVSLTLAAVLLSALRDVPPRP